MKRHTKRLLVLMGLVMLGIWVAPVAADAVSEQRKAKRKLLAIRAARVDGMQHLIHGSMAAMLVLYAFLATRTGALDLLDMKEVKDSHIQAAHLNSAERGHGH